MTRFVPPYPTIRHELLSGRVIPFLGSGASLCKRSPLNAPWRKRRRGKQDLWTVSYIPTALELATYLAQMSSFPKEESIELAKVAQYFKTVSGNKILIQQLQEIFQVEQPFNSIHAYLAKINNPLLIVTTNYDDLIERAFDESGKPYDLVVHTTDTDLGDRLLWWSRGHTPPEEILAKDLYIDLSSVSVIYKMHGAVDKSANQKGQYVITEDDYIDFLTRMIKSAAIPDIFAEPFQTRPFLFLGYGLYDWNLRVVLNRIEKEFRRPRDIVSWAIQRNPKALEQRLWQARGVDVYDMTIDDFLGELDTLQNANKKSFERKKSPNKNLVKKSDRKRSF